MAVRLVVAINPASGTGRSAEVGASVVAQLTAAGHSVTVAGGGDAAAVERSLRAAVAEPIGAVVAVGGDGTVNLVANVLAGTGIPIGIVPTGSGNDISRSLGLPYVDTEVALDRVLQALAPADGPVARAIDAVHLSNGRWFVGVLSAGFDAAVNARANGLRWPRGNGRYVIAVLLEIGRLRPIRYRMTLDRDPRQFSAVMLTAGNTRAIGGGMLVLPDAVPDDGLLDVLIASALSRFELLMLLPKVFRGTHVTDAHVEIVRGKVLTIAGGDGEMRPITAYADGEPVGTLPLTLEIVPNALRILGA